MGPRWNQSLGTGGVEARVYARAIVGREQLCNPFPEIQGEVPQVGGGMCVQMLEMK